MKTPFHGETRGIMMSGDSPVPNSHGDHLCELEALAISQPLNSKIMTDKAIQMNPADFSTLPVDNCLGKPSDKAVQMNSADIINEPVGNNVEPHTTLAGLEEHADMAASTFPTIRRSDGQRATVLEDEICNSDEISSFCPSDVREKSDDSVLRSEEIETALDQTDNPSTQKFSVNNPQEEDSCLINCLFYLDECCTCTII
ncbi:hypothetical protein R5R35_009846 [Gryllus longicercus]|uniref:Uncharacterized protein n=1 Tax=Gryllus longicercus TaxID=2509291 RepID=A0AAN9VSN3_9ORTH|nr:Uncharacterized protein GBIM_13150 [Gryllus bimaculatus]